MAKAIDLRELKALSKEQREVFAHEIQKDGDLWNAVNGVGGLSEFSDQARLQGTITDTGLVLPKAKVQILKDEQLIHHFLTNEQGYFKIDIPPADYQLIIINGEKKEEISVKALKGITSTINHDFKVNSSDSDT